MMLPSRSTLVCCLWLLQLAMAVRAQAQPAAPAPQAAEPAAAAPASAAEPTPDPAPDPAPTPPKTNITPQMVAAAQRHFAAGEQAFREGRYDAALNDFTTSYELSKEPDLLYNLHQVALKLGQKEMAVGYLREYARQRPEDASKIEAEITAINAAPAQPNPALSATPTSTDTNRFAPRWSAAVLLVFGGACVVTGAALLGVMATLSPHAPADQVPRRSMLAAGGFLLATGAAETVGGLVLYLKRRPPARAAFRPGGAGFQLVGEF